MMSVIGYNISCRTHMYVSLYCVMCYTLIKAYIHTHTHIYIYTEIHIHYTEQIQ